MIDIFVFGAVYSACGGFLLARPFVYSIVFSDFKREKYQGFKWNRSDSIMFKTPNEAHDEIQELKEIRFNREKINSQTALIGIIALLSGTILLILATIL